MATENYGFSEIGGPGYSEECYKDDDLLLAQPAPGRTAAFIVHGTMLGQGDIIDLSVLFQTQERALSTCRCNDDHVLRLSHVGGQRDFLAVVVPLGAG